MMYSSKFNLIVAAGAAIFALTACGGKSSGGAASTSTPSGATSSSKASSSSVASSSIASSSSSSGATSSSSSSSSGVASSSSSSSSSASSSSVAANSVTITGLVTDNIMPNASITFYVGGQVVLAIKADADGYYSATLKVDAADIGKPIKAVAKGAAGQAQVELVSVLPSVATLATLAGADHIVDKTENFGVNITNVTTAEYVLSGNAATLPATDSALQNSMLNTDAAQKYKLAALIKIVADGQHDMPEGAATTLELATKTALVKHLNP